MACTLAEGGEELDLEKFKTGSINKKDLKLRCRGNVESFVRIKRGKNGQPEGIEKPGCLHFKLTGGDGEGWAPITGANDLNLRVEADSFCSLDDDLRVGGSLTLEYKEKALSTPSTLKVKGAVDFKFEFKAEPITAEVRRQATGVVNLDVRTGGAMHFALTHASEESVDDSDPFNREPRWLVAPTEPDAEVFKVAEGATSFEYGLTPNRCCSAEPGKPLELMLQPGSLTDGKFTPYAADILAFHAPHMCPSRRRHHGH